MTITTSVERELEKDVGQMKNYKPLEDGRALVNPFTIVMNNEHDSYLLLFGRGITKNWMVVRNHT
ncbi:hypothetical protein HanPI659440_Chr16g0646071 [Helianthus annuus]|nr:hypothetical protein HanPI659440_Chr16g0646071 [Helianthus annuus]